MPVLPPPCVKPLDLYRPRDPQASDLWRLMDQHFETFQQVYDCHWALQRGPLMGASNGASWFGSAFGSVFILLFGS